METYSESEIMGNFRTERYSALNKCRWDHFLAMGIPIKDQRIFEPGAGIGDQTEWLLQQEPEWIYVSEGRKGNADLIRKRFLHNVNVWVKDQDLESMTPEFIDSIGVDLIFCYGVYYHLRESSDFRIMRQFSKMGKMIAFDYLAGNDHEVSYGYDNPSTSISQYGFRPRPETLMAALKEIWGFAYEPKEPLIWVDPVATEDRRVAVASHSKLDNPNLIQI